MTAGRYLDRDCDRSVPQLEKKRRVEFNVASHGTRDVRPDAGQNSRRRYQARTRPVWDCQTAEKRPGVVEKGSSIYLESPKYLRKWNIYNITSAQSRKLLQLPHAPHIPSSHITDLAHIPWSRASGRGTCRRRHNHTHPDSPAVSGKNKASQTRPAFFLVLLLIHGESWCPSLGRLSTARDLVQVLNPGPSGKE